MRKDNTIYYYYTSGLKQPACGINISNNKKENKNVSTTKGDKFDQETCISSNSRLWYFSSTEPCEWTYYLSPSNKNIIDISASCNDYGCLTRYGWVYMEDTCYYNKDPIIDDANWMGYLDETLKINQINIPGTHNSGTYAIDNTNIFESVLRNKLGKTQNYDITDQLNSGIRYLDLRLEINDNDELHITHAGYDYEPNHFWYGAELKI